MNVGYILMWQLDSYDALVSFLFLPLQDNTKQHGQTFMPLAGLEPRFRCLGGGILFYAVATSVQTSVEVDVGTSGDTLL